MSFRFFQVSNLPTAPFGAVATGELVPLGVRTASNNCNCGCNGKAFTLSTTGANTVNLNDPGIYRISGSFSVVATAAGLVTLNLVQNGVVVYTVSETATAAGDTVNLSISPFILRNCPSYVNGFYNRNSAIQISNTGVALTSGVSNLLIEHFGD